MYIKGRNVPFIRHIFFFCFQTWTSVGWAVTAVIRAVRTYLEPTAVRVTGATASSPTCIRVMVRRSYCIIVRDWSLITGRGRGYKMGKLLVFAHPSRQGKTCYAPPPTFIVPPPPPSVWLKLQAYMLNTPKPVVTPPPPLHDGLNSSPPSFM